MVRLNCRLMKTVLEMHGAVDSLIIAETADNALEKMKTLDFKSSAVVIEKEFPKGWQLISKEIVCLI